MKETPTPEPIPAWQIVIGLLLLASGLWHLLRGMDGIGAALGW